MQAFCMHTHAHKFIDIHYTFEQGLGNPDDIKNGERGESEKQERRGGKSEDRDTVDMVRKFTIKRNKCIRHFFNESVFSGGHFQLFGSGTRIQKGGRRGRTQRQNGCCTGVLTPRKRPLMLPKHDWQEGVTSQKSFTHTQAAPHRSTPSTPSSSHKAILAFAPAVLASTFMWLQKPCGHFSKG